MSLPNAPVGSGGAEAPRDTAAASRLAGRLPTIAGAIETAVGSAGNGPSRSPISMGTRSVSDSHNASSPRAGSARLQQSTSPASSDGFLSSGQSPGRSSAHRAAAARGVTRLHLVGPGQVGRAFLRQLAARADRQGLRVVAVSDSSGTTYLRDGVDVDALCAHKERGGRVAELARAESVPTDLAIRLVSADIVVDATPSSAAGTEQAIVRGRAALQAGASLALCSKNALARVAAEWLQPATRARVRCNATLGGTGAQLHEELDELRRDCTAVALVGNVTTTAIVTAIERGASVEEGIAEAERLGFLEPSASLDLDGSDAATKLQCVWGAVFGDTFRLPPAFESIRREDVRELDPDLLRERAARGATTRLVARATREGGRPVACFEELPIGSPLAAPQDRVVYSYQLPKGSRVHTGLGVGYERTAEALWRDVAALAAEVSR